MCNPSTHVGLQLAIEAGGAEGRVGGQTLVPLAGPRLGHRLHEASLELADTRVMAHDFCLCLFHILREKERSKRKERIPKRSKEKAQEDRRREI